MNNNVKKIVLLSGLFFVSDLKTEQIDNEKEKSVDCSTPNEQSSAPSKLSLIKENLSLQDKSQDLDEDLDLDDSFDDEDELEGIDESVLMQLLQDGGLMDLLSSDSSENPLTDDQVKEFLELMKNFSEVQKPDLNEESKNTK